MGVSNLGGGVHELEFILPSKEQLKAILPLSTIIGRPKNESRDERIFITIQTEEENFWLRILLNNTQQIFDPIDVAILPFGQVKHPLTIEGRLNFNFWINNSQNLDSCLFRFESQSGAKIQDLQLDNSDLPYDTININNYQSYSLMNNVSTGIGQIGYSCMVNSLHDRINFEVSATRNVQFTPIQVSVNGSKTNLRNSVKALYTLNNYEFALQQYPYYYFGSEATYLLNFTTQRDFTLRLDAHNREEIRSLQFEMMPSSFSVTKTSFIDEPCYAFNFQMEQTSGCYISLNLKSKEWVINPENMTLDDIPNAVKEKYLDPSSSFDGETFDTNEHIVQQWAQEISENQTNPYKIASNIYDNLTNTIVFPDDWKELEKNSTFKEDVSEILDLKLGVCRHFARSFASLCICSGLPARTVCGTAFGFLNETYKKNHEWTEVYLPGYTWVAIDASWNQSFLLNENHAKLTYWTYMEGTLNVKKINSTVERKFQSDSLKTISHLIQLCDELPDGTAEVDTLLDKARFNANQGKIHEALVCIAEAYILSDRGVQTNPAPEEISILAITGIILVALAIIYIKRKKLYALFETLSRFRSGKASYFRKGMGVGEESGAESRDI